MLHCPQHDSLIRDHGVSLAVCVQETLINHGIGGCTRVVDRLIETERSTEQLVTPLESTSGIEDEAQQGVSHESVVGHAAANADFCGATGGQISACSDMDVDPVSMRLSPSELLPSDGFFSDGFFHCWRKGCISGREFRAKIISEGYVY